jgi:hypothetical protein
MSHTTSIKAIKIVDINALQAAIDELNQKGVKCSLVADAQPRAFYPNQQGMGKADYVIKLDASRYDVGLYKQEDGSYEARTDFWGGDIEKLLGGKATSDEYKESAKLGRLFQLYGVNATQNKLRMQGKSVRRVENEQTGQIQLVATGY